jgi:hypothetical protein
MRAGKIIIFTPEQPYNEYGAFSDCQNIEQPKEICDVCGIDEATLLIRYKKDEKPMQKYCCPECYSHPDLRHVLRTTILTSVTKI